MTIPIMPGPFSFLQYLGQAGGNYFQGRAAGQQQALENLLAQANLATSLRDKGYLTPEQFGQMAGGYLNRNGDIGPMRHTGPEIQGDFMRGLANQYQLPEDVQIPGISMGATPMPPTTVRGRESMTPTQRMTAQKFLGEVPESDVLKEQTTSGQLRGGLPYAEDVGRAAATGALRDQATQDADNLVEAYLSRNQMPRVNEESVAAVQNIRQFAGQYGEQYRGLIPRMRDEDILAAFSRRRVQDAKMEIDRLGAQARNFASISGAADRTADTFRMIAQQYKDLQQDEAATKALAGYNNLMETAVLGYDNAVANGRQPSNIQTRAAQARAAYNAINNAYKFNQELYNGFAGEVANRAAGTGAPGSMQSVFNLPTVNESQLTPEQRGWLKLARTLIQQGQRPGMPGWYIEDKMPVPDIRDNIQLPNQGR